MEEASMQVQKVKQSKSLKKGIKNRVGEFLIEKIIFILGLTALIIVALIFYFLFRSGIEFFKDITFKQFFLGASWFPVSANPQYGILPLITGSLLVTAGAILISVPIGIGSAIFISEVAPPKTKMVLKVIIEFLSAIPSVVLGFLGIIVLTSWIRIAFSLSSGFTVLTGSILVSLMALPTIITISDDAITALPKEYREASLALGASKWETIKHVLVPGASSGIIASIMLGIGRAIGETMAVMMATGNAARIADSFLASGRTMTATIAAEMGDTVRGGTHYHALFAVGIVLLLVTTCINLVSAYVVSRAKREGR